MTYPPQELVDRLFERFRTPLTLVDAAQRLVAYSVQPADSTDAVRRDTLMSKELDEASRYVHQIADSADAFARSRRNEPGRS